MKIVDLYESDLSNVINTIKNSKWYKNANYDLFRGYSSDSEFIHLTIDKSRDRKPKDSNIKVHEYANALALEKFGYKVRNGLFVTTDKRQAGMYGKAWVVFPVSDYKMFMNPDIYDFYDDMGDETGEYIIKKYVESYVSDMVDITNTNVQIGDGEIILFGNAYMIPIDIAMKHGLLKGVNDLSIDHFMNILNSNKPGALDIHRVILPVFRSGQTFNMTKKDIISLAKALIVRYKEINNYILISYLLDAPNYTPLSMSDIVNLLDMDTLRKAVDNVIDGEVGKKVLELFGYCDVKTLIAGKTLVFKKEIPSMKYLEFEKLLSFKVADIQVGEKALSKFIQHLIHSKTMKIFDQLPHTTDLILKTFKVSDIEEVINNIK